MHPKAQRDSIGYKDSIGKKGKYDTVKLFTQRGIQG